MPYKYFIYELYTKKKIIIKNLKYLCVNIETEIVWRRTEDNKFYQRILKILIAFFQNYI